MGKNALVAKNALCSTLGNSATAAAELVGKNAFVAKAAHLSVCLSVCRSVCLSVCLSVHLSVCLSVRCCRRVDCYDYYYYEY